MIATESSIYVLLNESALIGVIAVKVGTKWQLKMLSVFSLNKTKITKLNLIFLYVIKCIQILFYVLLIKK